MTGLIPKLGIIVKPNNAQHGKRPTGASMVMIPVMGNKLRELRLQRGWTLARAAAEFGMSASGYHKVERSERKLHVDRVTKAAAIYSVSVSAITDQENTSKIVGEIGPTGVVVLYDTKGGLVPAPNAPASKTQADALEVRGGAIPGLAEEHWLVFYDEKLDGLPEDRVGELCVVAVEGGDLILLGRIYFGKEAGLFDVVPPGQKPVRGVQIVWSAVVSWIKPR